MKKIRKEDIPTLSNEELLKLGLKVAGLMISNKIGLGWDDLPDTVMLSDYIEEGMSFESFKSAIKDAVNEKMASFDENGDIFESVSGEKDTKKAQNGSKKESEDYVKKATKKIKDFNTSDDNKVIIPKYEQSDEEKEIVADIEQGGGMQDLTYNNKPSKIFTDRQKKALTGDETTGNGVYTGKENGNTESTWGASNDNYGEELLKRTKRRAEKIAKSTPNTYSFGDDMELTGKNNKPKTIAYESVKPTITKLTTKNTLGGVDRAKSIIPEKYKKNGNVIIMTDGNETYKLKWNSEINEAEVISAENKTEISEATKAFNKLSTYKSNVNENKNTDFKNMMDISRKVISESKVSDPEYTHFAINKKTGKIIEGWNYEDYNKKYLTENKNKLFFEDVEDLELGLKKEDVKVVTKESLNKSGINPREVKNWRLLS